MKTSLKLLMCGVAGLLTVPAIADEELLTLSETPAYLPDSFSTLTAALVSADLVGVLNGDGPFTVFAPDNDAFDKAASAILGEGSTGPELLLALEADQIKEILLFHVLPGAFTKNDVLAVTEYETAGGAILERDGITLMGATSANLVLDSLDIPASNGIVHVIDSVLLPPEQPGTIVDIATGNEAFTTLVKAVVKAGLVDFLSSEHRNVTVFAPTNTAFDNAAEALLGEGATGEELIDSLSKRTVRRIVLNHVLYREYFSDDVLDRRWFWTYGRSILRRDGLTLKARNGQGNLIAEEGFINIDASNGVVHVVDGVLIP